jgi:hypothetical protein
MFMCVGCNTAEELYSCVWVETVFMCASCNTAEKLYSCVLVCNTAEKMYSSVWTVILVYQTLN